MARKALWIRGPAGYQIEVERVVRMLNCRQGRRGWWSGQPTLQTREGMVGQPEDAAAFLKHARTCAALTRHWASRALRGTRRFTCWATSSAHFTIIGYQLKSGQNPGGDVLSLQSAKERSFEGQDLKNLRSWQPGGLRSVRPTKDLGFTSGAERSPSYRIN